MSSAPQSPQPRDKENISRFPSPSPAAAAVLASPTASPALSSSPQALSPPVSPPPMSAAGDDPSTGDNDNDDYTDPAAQDLPLTMTASTVLLNLPRDAAAALATAGRFAKDKVVVRFKPVGSAPSLSGGAGDVRRKITATQKFEVVVAFVRRALRVQESESVFLYINSSFAPALDEVVGNLHQCFKDSHDQLNVSYSLTPAFG
ncbi:Ubiquitin-like protein [Sporothrix epigloea]|uniref:Ubiquitin-like protein ATG12 n=1 Tax=Sporothrix epigloea TaxID=1892477 RepID=A0ABP0DJP0_9PEZI